MEAGGQVDPPDPPVSAVAQIDGVVIAPAQIAEQRRTDREAVVVALDVAFFAVDVPRRADLAGQPDAGKILPIAVGGQDEIVERSLDRKSTSLNSSQSCETRMQASA